ncbi:30S ribosomal protein S3 [Candidatus Micrarchaeota archaeon]|nr:30S ribosomal protein S3 [Candidatus Micrarchaeota archaeon]
MAIGNKFVKTAIKEMIVKEYLQKELDRAGVSNIVIQKTPIATRISIAVRKPGIVVGKKGANIRDLCEMLEKKFGIENPQIEVLEVKEPALDAKLMAEKIGKKIEAKPNVKPIVRMALQEVMRAGALGAEIRVAGKIVGKGGKAKTITVRKGYLKKSGDALKLVSLGTYTCYLKAGSIGITVKILPQGAIPVEKVEITSEDKPEEIVEIEETIEEEKELKEIEKEEKKVKKK